jgi:hypothetical protein
MQKLLMIGAAGLAFVAMPGFAQQYVPGAGSGNLVQGPGGAPVTPDTPAYVGQRNGEAYNYRHAYGAARCRVAIRHEWRDGRRVTIHRRDCW